MDSNKPLVSVLCLVYNQAAYVKDCINGFLQQKTNFPIEVIINDDCSSDGTTDIVKEYAEKYPEIIKAVFHDKNQYSQGINVIYNCFNIAQGKYLAFCEGDDYWTDPYKLQKQVDFLENNEEYGLVHTNFKEINIDGKELGDVMERNNFLCQYEGDVFEKILVLLGIKTLTFCMRKKLFPIDRTDVDLFLGDKYVVLNVASQSKIHYLPDVTGIYRSLQGTACHSPNYVVSDKFERKVQRLDEYYLNTTPNISKKTKMLMRFKWGVYDMLFMIASNDYSIRNLPNLFSTLPYIKTKDYKYIIIYFLVHHSRCFFQLMHRRMIKSKYYNVSSKENS